MISDRDLDLMWAAGYFDAKGGVYIKDSPEQVQIVLTHRDHNVLALFRSIVAQGWMTSPRISKASVVKNTNRLAIQERQAALEVLTLLRPRLRNARLIADVDAALAWLQERAAS